MNKLIREKSAYLLQHADNPVHWWPWGRQAAVTARADNKPVFLSIGYSSCHWCHVMNHESFNDKETAALLNNYFIPIKVDREELPDIDHYYQQACQLFTRNGGWPLSAFLLPDLRPFFVGTYFPNKPRVQGGISFKQVLAEINRAYRQEYPSLEQNAAQIAEALGKGLHQPRKTDIQEAPASEKIFQKLDPYLDKKNGGIGRAPKFPHFSFFEFALEQMNNRMLSRESVQWITHSLECMLFGGITDHAGGGIHRYATDSAFRIPHFEKMLYDQAGFLIVLAKFSKYSPHDFTLDALSQTLDYLTAEMLSEEGYFFASQDADSDGKEGIYFTYAEEEFKEVIENSSQPHWPPYEKIKSWFLITREGDLDGLNTVSLDIKQKKEITDSWEIIREIRQALLAERKKRPPPPTDTKGVASWNFFMLSALCDVIQYAVFPQVRKKSEDLLKKIQNLERRFLTPENKIRHSTTRIQNVLYLEDYAFYLHALLRLYETTSDYSFKNKLQKTIPFVLKEFISPEGRLLTRAQSFSPPISYPNAEVGFFDSSFKSCASLLLTTLKKSALLFHEPGLFAPLDKTFKKLQNACLENPVACGEGLRLCQNPPRLLHIPKAFLSRRLNIPPRFVLDYHSDKDEKWQICSETRCLHAGEGPNSLISQIKQFR